MVDLVGKQFNSWTVVKHAPNYTFDNHRNDYWHCRCVCGSEAVVWGYNLVKEKSRCCGCINKGYKPPGFSARNSIYCGYKAAAKKRGIYFELPREYFIEMTKKNCFYCDLPPQRTRVAGRSNGVCLYNGIDRVNNLLGYVETNVVTCCMNCNLAKRQLSVEAFFLLVKRIYERHIKNE